MTRSTFSTASSLRWKGIFSIITALLYGASPLDLIPDLIPVLGLTDDAVVMLTLTVVAIKFFRAARRRNQPNAPITRPIPPVSHKPRRAA